MASLRRVAVTPWRHLFMKFNGSREKGLKCIVPV
jgi:hypothetical protein